MVKNKDGTETIYYCECGQAIRLRKKDNTWVHYGWKRAFETYGMFLERTNHPINVSKITSRVWGSCIEVVKELERS